MFNVFFPDGDMFISRSGKFRFTRADALVIAQAIGGTIKRVYPQS